MARKRKGYLQILVYLREPIHRAFKMLVADQKTTMGEWLADRVEEAVRQEGYFQEKNFDEYQNLAELVKENRALLDSFTKIDQTVLDTVETGGSISEIDFLRIGVALNIPQQSLDALLERSFGHVNEEDKSLNGV